MQSLTPTSSEPGRSTDSYAQILRSSALVGAASGTVILIGIVRTKAMAVMLGPAGLGLMGALNVLSDLVHGIAGMGVSKSGVRSVAEAAGRNDATAVSRTIISLRRTVLFLGLLGAAMLLLAAQPLALATFGSIELAGTVAVLAVVVFLRLVSDGQNALLQGLRRIADTAWIGFIGSLLGTVLSVALVYWLRERGVVIALVVIAAAMAGTSWWFARRVRIEPAAMDARETARHASVLLRQGMAFMASGILVMGMAYAVRIIVIQHHGLTGAGLYQAAWALGGMYVGIVLQAMGADFYPRLVATGDDDAACNRLVNEQALVSLVLAGIGVIGTLAFAPLVVRLFYSSEFAAASEILRWICLGMMLRVISAPMGFVIVARNAQRLFIVTEVAWAVVSVGLAWLLIPLLGLSGAGVAFAAGYVFHVAMIYPLVRRMSGFAWSRKYLGVGAVVIPLVILTFAMPFVLEELWSVALGAVNLLLFCVYALRTLGALVPDAPLSRRISSIIDPIMSRWRAPRRP